MTSELPDVTFVITTWVHTIMTPPCTATPRLLVVEDEAILGLLIEAILQELGHTSRHVCSVAEARPLVAGPTSWDLVIVDLGLPDGDGLEVIELLWANHAATPVIVETGYAELPKALDAAEAEGRVVLLRKPFGPVALESAMRQLLSPHRRARPLRLVEERPMTAR
jgi:DNA-binding NtrC family response regulator